MRYVFVTTFALSGAPQNRVAQGNAAVYLNASAYRKHPKTSLYLGAIPAPKKRLPEQMLTSTPSPPQLAEFLMTAKGQCSGHVGALAAMSA